MESNTNPKSQRSLNNGNQAADITYQRKFNQGSRDSHKTECLEKYYRDSEINPYI